MVLMVVVHGGEKWKKILRPIWNDQIDISKFLKIEITIPLERLLSKQARTKQCLKGGGGAL